MQHNVYDNVFAIGDCASVPVHGVSAGAALSQARVAAHNILSSPMRKLLLDVLMPSVDDQQDKVTTTPTHPLYPATMPCHFALLLRARTPAPQPLVLWVYSMPLRAFSVRLESSLCSW